MTNPATTTSKRHDRTVWERFHAIARAYPTELAYTSGSAAVSYAELAARARAARSAILVLGSSAPGFVGILTNDRVNALVGILGAAGSGHAYVLLDSSDPDKRLAHILNQVEPFGILADEALLDRAGRLSSRRTINLDTVEPRAGDDRVEGLPVAPDSRLYVSFTSGSTGVAKGVCQTHRNLIFYVEAYIEAMEIHARDKISWLFAPGASASNMDIYGALFTGAELCAFELKSESFAAMAAWIDDKGIVLLHTVPTVVRQLLGAIEENRRFDSVRVVDLAGEMLFARDVARMRAHFRPECRILNRLAATEASFISSLIVTDEHERSDGLLSVGKPPAGVEVAILRPDGTQAGTGETGTIAIASPHVAIGYLRRPDLNAEAFSDTVGRPGWRTYRSADLGFIDGAGNLNFIGRSGSRIKLRGQAVDLAEVEAALYECPAVSGAVVLPRVEPGGEAREILAYLTLVNGASAETTSEIRNQLSLSLPAYMLPSGYVFLDQFPYTTTSKVDRLALETLDVDSMRFRPGYVSPQGEAEERVAAIFASALDVRAVGRLDDFFLLGGDSLALVNLQILATETFGQQLPGLHEDATVKGVAERMRAAERTEQLHAPIVLPIRTGGSATPLFVVHGRRGQAHVGRHFLDLLGEQQPLYALQARGLDGKQEPHLTVEAMAQDYVAEMRKVQPSGPYFIGGFCAGGYVALEMIRLLHLQGEKFYPPLLIDPPLPHFKLTAAQSTEEVLLWQFERRVKSGQWKLDLQNPNAVRAAIRVAHAFEDALQAHKPQRVSVRSMIIATVKRWRSAESVRNVFGPKAEVFLIAGDHGDMLSPTNHQFGTVVRKCIAHVAQLTAFYHARTSGSDQRKDISPRRSPRPGVA